MRTTIDGAGRIVVPKELRDRLGLAGGAEVEIAEHDGRIEIEPAETLLRLVGEGHDVSAVPDEALPALTEAMVRDAIDRTRR